MVLLKLLVLLQWLLLGTSLLSATEEVSEEEQAKPSQYCSGSNVSSSSCGNLEIPYPFGTVNGCFRKGFKITCNTSSEENLPKAFLGDTNYEVINISVAENLVRIKNSFPGSVAHTCLEPNGSSSSTHDHDDFLGQVMIDFTDTPFALVPGNRLIVTGYNSAGLIKFGKKETVCGCNTFSHKNHLDKTNNGTCSGIGCCHVAIPKHLKTVETLVGYILTNVSDIREVLNKTKLSAPYLCASAFVVDKQNFTFKASDLDNDSKNLAEIQHSTLLLDWAISNQTCNEARRNSTYACKDLKNGRCENYTVEDGNIQGYYCKCKKGFHGNPYISNGCQDIDECNTANNPCKGNYKCINTVGSYHCKPLHSLPLQLFLAILSISVLLLFAIAIYFFIKRRKLMKLREKFFRKNGGLLLQQKIPSHQSAMETARIFTVKELEKATDNYSRTRIIGQGGNGTVYKGIIGDNQTVAVKKSKIESRSQIEQFINEVVVASQIKHRNTVRLLGCCLETEVPLLVYEFVPNGSLHYHIHHPEKAGSISWDIRLRIATETASALAYLHFAASTPIIHRDVKTANILLDENCIAKVSDFGASRLIPIDKTQITTLVQGTFGYLDPQYFRTSQLTEKSDVYSYGVVLVELLTGQMPVSFARPELERNLSSYFVLSMQQDRLFEILEPGIVNEENREELKAVADLATRCLMLNGNERPSMKEVLIELIELRKLEKHPWGKANCEHALSSLHDKMELNSTSTLSSSSNAYSGIPTDLALSLDLPR